MRIPMELEIETLTEWREYLEKKFPGRFTYRVVADRAGVDFSHLSKWEKGSRPISPEDYAKVAQALRDIQDEVFDEMICGSD